MAMQRQSRGVLNMVIKKDVKVMARQHFRSSLDFQNSLCRVLSQLLEEKFENCNVFTFHELTDDTRNLEEGNGTPNGTDYLAQYIKNMCNKNAYSIAVFDDVISLPGDSIPEIDKVHTVIFDDHILHWCFIEEISTLNLKKLIWGTSVSWHFACAIGTFTRQKQQDADYVKNQITNNFLSFNVEEVILGGFDGEGFVHFNSL